MRSAARAVSVILVGIALLGPSLSFAQSTPSLENRVKANYLVRFAAFVEWPSTAFASPSAPMIICVAGPDPFGAALDRAAEGQTAQSRPIAVRRPRSASEAEPCHILYAAVGSGPGFRTPVHGRLLVTEADDGGTIAFRLRDARVRFDVDLAAARRSGLSLNSRLLDLAVTVRGR